MTHNFLAKEIDNKIIINGSFDVNVWYSYDNDTKTTVVTKKIDYIEEEKLNVGNENVVNKDVIVRSLKQPTCISAKEDGNVINLEIEKELGLEIIGDTKVKIASVEEEDNWDILDDSEDNEIDKINTNYLNEEIIK